MNKKIDKTVLVTGGAGFIGSHLVEKLISVGLKVINVDCLTYAGNWEGIKHFESNPLYEFKNVNINNFDELQGVFRFYQPNAVFHLAAESHVDNSITDPINFIQTNIIGTYNVLQASQQHYSKMVNKNFKFIHVSTDEVYGSLGLSGKFSEETAYDPRSPYSASKAASDHLVKAWWHTYNLPAIITNCSNNYGPNQNQEKLIPKIIYNAINKRKIPVYGNGKNIRDWLNVSDHVEALLTVFRVGVPGETYNIGSNNEISNIDLIEKICGIIDSKIQLKYKCFELVEYVTDRQGHDFRYAINSQKIRNELGWQPNINFNKGLENTINWYLDDFLGT